MKNKYVISLNISLGTFPEFCSEIIKLAEQRISSYVCIANVHMCIEAFKDRTYKNIVNSADIITPDGMPIAKSLNWLYSVKQDKVSGPDLMPTLLKDAEKLGLKVFFYGSTEKILSDLRSYCSVSFPNLKIVGAISPPFRELSFEESETYVNLINVSETNLLFVALGCPKQERWMHSMKGKINATMLGVGGAFSMLTGAEKRAPEWMQNMMLEWLFRLIQDPKRLYKRYLVTNTYFVILILINKLKVLFQE